MVSAHYYENIYHRAFIFHMLICLERDMTHIDIELNRLKVKVRRITFGKKLVSLPIILRTVYHTPFRFHMLIGRGGGLTPIDFVLFRIKGTRVTLVKNCFRSFS